MNISNAFKTLQSRVNNSTFGLLSLREYYDSTKDKILSFISNSKDTQSAQTVTWTDEVTGEVTTISVSQDKYYEAISNPLGTMVFTDVVTGQLVTITGSRLQGMIPEWPQETVDQSVSTITMAIDNNGQKVVGVLNSTDYTNCLNETVDEVKMYLNGSQDYIMVSRDSVLDAVDNLSDQISIQGEFISYCLDNETVSAQDFITKALAGVTATTKQLAEQYGSLLTSGDPAEAIKQFISLRNNASYSVEQTDQGNDYIVVYDANDYTGITVTDILWSKISAGLSIAWNAITEAWNKIGNVFSAIWEGFKKGTVWLLKLIAGRYFTRYTNASRSNGIIDIPVFQYVLGEVSGMDSLNHLSISPFTGSLKRAQRNLINDTTGITDNSAYKYSTYYNGKNSIDLPALMWNILDTYSDPNSSQGLLALLKSLADEIDGKVFIRPADVFLPSRYRPDLGFILRVGLSKDNFDRTVLMLQGFPFVPKGWQESFENDRAVYVGLKTLFGEVLGTLAQMYPILAPWKENGTTNTPDDALSGAQTACTNYWFGDPGQGEDNIDVVSNLRMFSDSDFWNNYVHPAEPGESLAATRDLAVVMRIICGGIIPYVISCLVSQAEDLTLIPHYCQWWKTDYQQTNPAGWTDDFETPSAADLKTIYASFIQRSLVPTSIHYQTVVDMTREIVIGVSVLLLAAAATFVAIKFAKFRTNLKLKTEVLTGYADNMSWTMGNNPTKEQMAAYKKARRKANRLNKLCSKFGLSSYVAIASDSNSLMTSIQDYISSMRGIDANSTDASTGYSIIDVLKLIKA